MQCRPFTRFAAVLVLASAWACGGGYGSSNPASPSPTVSGPPTIVISSNNGSRSFSPNPASLGGQMVVFRNSDTVVHRVRLNDFTLDTGDIAPGATSSPLLMPVAGTNYHCPLHPSMIGAVGPTNGAPPPSCSGDYC